MKENENTFTEEEIKDRQETELLGQRLSQEARELGTKVLDLNQKHKETAHELVETPENDENANKAMQNKLLAIGKEMNETQQLHKEKLKELNEINKILEKYELMENEMDREDPSQENIERLRNGIKQVKEDIEDEKGIKNSHAQFIEQLQSKTENKPVYEGSKDGSNKDITLEK